MPDLTIDNFAYGLMTKPDPADIPLGAAQSAQNVVVDDGTLRVRPGREVAALCPCDTSTGLRAVGELFVSGHVKAGTSTVVEHRFVGIIGTKVYWTVDGTSAPARGNTAAYLKGQCVAVSSRLYECTTTGTTAGSAPTFNTVDGTATTDGGVTWTRRALPVFQEINSAFHVNATNRVRMQQHADKLYLVDGEHPVLELDADGVLRWLEEFPAPTVAPTISPSMSYLTLDTGEGSDSAHGRTGEDRGYYYTSASHTWYNTNLWNNGVWVAREEGTDEPEETTVDGLTMRRLEAPANVIQNGLDGAAMPATIILEAVGRSETTLDCGDVLAVKRLATPLDLSKASTVQGYIRVHSGGATVPGSIKFIFKESEGAAWQSVACTLTGLNNTDEFQLVADISGLGATLRDAVQFIGWRFDDLVLDAIDRVELHTGDFGYPSLDEMTDMFTHGAWIAFGPLTATITESSTLIEYETYKFTYTYWRTENGAIVESAPYQNPNDFEHTYAEYTVGAAVPETLNLTVSYDAGFVADTNTPHGVYVYVQGGSNATMRRIATLTYPADDGVSFNGAITADMLFMQDYVGPPPEAATMLCLYRNRMAYIAQPPRDKWLRGHDYAVGMVVVPTARNGYAYRCTTAGRAGDTEPTWGTTVGTAQHDFAADAADTATVTISNASPAVVSWTAHDLPIGTPIAFTTDGTLPAPLVAGTTYFIIAEGYGADTFQIAATLGGASISNTTAGSGTHTGATVDSPLTWTCIALGAADTVYLSNLGDPTRVPIAATSLLQTPVTYGGWADVERFGDDVTGIAPFGNMLVVFKATSTFTVVGDPGASQPTDLGGDISFGIIARSNTVGCLSHESIAQVGGLLVWLGRDTVYGWDGQAMRELSEVIAPTVKGYTAAQQGTAFAVWSPRERRYLLVLPAVSSPAAACASTALLWALRAAYGEGQHPWMPWTAQPGACGLYSAHADTPGVYLADLYGTGGTGKLFRLSAAARTDANSSGAASDIDWFWLGAEVSAGKSLLQVQEADLDVLVPDPASATTYDVTVGVYPASDSSRADTLACVVERITTTTISAEDV